MLCPEHTVITKGTGVKGFYRLLKSRISLSKRLHLVLAVGADALLVPVEENLLAAGQDTPADVVLIHIDYTVPLRYARNTRLRAFCSAWEIMPLSIQALSEDTAHDQYLLFRQRMYTPIHSNIQNILCEY